MEPYKNTVALKILNGSNKEMTIFQPGDFIIHIYDEEMVGEILSIEDGFIKHTCPSRKLFLSKVVFSKLSEFAFRKAYKLHPENDRLKNLRLFK